MIKYLAKARNRYVAVDGKRIVATAFVNEAGNYIQSLYVSLKYRRQGIALGLVRFITEHRGRKLNRCPGRLKNAAIHSLSAKLGDELLEEAKE